jgi:hypothetical protein
MAIGSNIRDELFDASDGINHEEIAQAFAFARPDFREYWLCVPTGGETWPNVAYVFNWSTNAWSKRPVDWTAAGTHLTQAGSTWGSMGTVTWATVTGSWADFTVSGSGDVPLYGDQVGAAHLFTEDGTPDTSLSFSTSDTDLGRPGYLKTVDRVRLRVSPLDNADITVELSVDGGYSWTTPIQESVTARATPGLLNVFFDIGRYTSEYFRVRVQSDERVDVQGIGLHIVDREETR